MAEEIVEGGAENNLSMIEIQRLINQAQIDIGKDVEMDQK